MIPFFSTYAWSFFRDWEEGEKCVLLGFLIGFERARGKSLKGHLRMG